MCVFEVKCAHQRVKAHTIGFGQRQKLVGDQHVLKSVVVEGLRVGLSVVDGGEVTVDQRIVGDGYGKSHHRATAYVAVHHAKNVGSARAICLEILDMEMGVVI